MTTAETVVVCTVSVVVKQGCSIAFEQDKGTSMVLLCFSAGWYFTFVTVRLLTSHEVPTAPKYWSYDSPLLESCNYKMTQCYIYFRNSSKN